MTRISTQVYVLVDGQRKAMEFTGQDGVTRKVSVDIDLAECLRCGALLPPTDHGQRRHADWHLAQQADD